MGTKGLIVIHSMVEIPKLYFQISKNVESEDRFEDLSRLAAHYSLCNGLRRTHFKIPSCDFMVIVHFCGVFGPFSKGNFVTQ